MSLVQELYQLQVLDLERDRLRRRLKEILGQLGETEELRAARASLEHIQAELNNWRVRQKDLELETQTLEAKIASVEERMYSGRVANPKVLADLQKDSAALRKQRSRLDEKSLEAMLAIEDKESRLDQAQAALSAIQTGWAAQQHSLAQERAALEARLAQADRDRLERVRHIPAEHLARYDSLRRTKNGIAVANLEEGFCSVCGVELSDRKLDRVIQGETLIFCSNCDRILVE